MSGGIRSLSTRHLGTARTSAVIHSVRSPAMTRRSSYAIGVRGPKRPEAARIGRSATRYALRLDQQLRAIRLHDQVDLDAVRRVCAVDVGTRRGPIPPRHDVVQDDVLEVGAGWFVEAGDVQR